MRYGNVIGSRGSVVPFFERLIAQRRQTLPITDPRMTRFWITLRSGRRLRAVLARDDAGRRNLRAENPSMRIVDLATAMAPDMPHEIVGIRPGEKLHEVMITEDDARTTLELDDRYVICPPSSTVGCDI